MSWRFLLPAVALSLACGDGGNRSAPAAPADASVPDVNHAREAGRDGRAPDAGHDAPARDVAEEPIVPTVCNGHAALCSLAYDAVAYPGTHDSYSDTDEGFKAPDQTHPVAQQLADGIRVLHFETHVYGGVVSVCHSVCQIGTRPFLDEMRAVAAFVTAHPQDVVTLLLERSDTVVTANDLADVMKQAGLAPYMHVQAPGAPWPTLGEMIGKRERVVALLDDPTGSSYAWLLPRWQLTWETPWDNETPADFARCDADRGAMGDGVYVVDTYMEDLPIESAAHAVLVNEIPFLIDRQLYCKRATSTLPNFVMVDFYEVGDVFQVVDMLNGFAPVPSDVNLEDFPPASWPPDGGVWDGGPSGDAAGPDAGSDVTMG